MPGVFIAPCLEQGRTGVGDYARALAHQVALLQGGGRMIALHDPYVAAPKESSSLGVAELRLPAKLPWPDRFAAAREFLRPASVDWISVQFVTYGYHSKGLPFGLAKPLSGLCGNAPVEIMFHELWSAGRGLRWRDRIYGVMQRWIIRDLVRRLRPAVLHTQATPYLEALERRGWNARRLSLFSNIPVIAFPIDERPGWLRAAAGLPEAAGRVIFCLFGSLYPQWRPETLLPILRLRLTESGQRGLIVSIGHLGEAGRQAWQRMQSTSDETLQFLETGPLPADEVSRWLQAGHFGISTTPPDLLEKSGAAVAMMEHGLPVLASREPVFGDAMMRRVQERHPLLAAGSSLADFQNVPRQPADGHALERVAEQFLGDLCASSRS